jgi:hypothetical protein
MHYLGIMLQLHACIDAQVCPIHHAGDDFYYVMGKMGISKDRVSLYGMRMLICNMEFNGTLWTIDLLSAFRLSTEACVFYFLVL